MKSHHTWITASLMILATATVAWGQAQTTGRISGRVVDEEGTPVVDARVELVSPKLQGERKLRTNERANSWPGCYRSARTQSASHRRASRAHRSRYESRWARPGGSRS